MNVTYLFGAGASKAALPIVNEIPQRLSEMTELLKQNQFQLSNTERFDDLKLPKTKYEIQKQFISDLEWLRDKCLDHASIDTFAKKLYLTKRWDELNRLKASFSAYLVIEQITRKSDRRYDSFYASILKEDYYKFPENIKILSWNYDSQFEKSFIEYTGNNEVQTNQAMLRIYTKYSWSMPDGPKFCILKLNGTTNLLKDRGFREYQYYNLFLESLTVEVLHDIIRNYAALLLANIQLFSGLSFAWEKYSTDRNNIISTAKEQVASTQILVVIGYSFPFFNREIDKDIIQSMTQLRKVYFQAPDAEILKERFQALRDDIPDSLLVPRHDVGQFLLPKELD